MNFKLITRLNNQTWLKLFFIFFVMLTLNGCQNTGAFRTQYNEVCAYEGSHTCQNKSMTTAKVKDESGTANYQLHFIEFDDQGALYSLANKRSVMQEVRKQTQLDSNVLLLTYIHGWNHNANGDSEDSDIVKFRTLLSRLAMENPDQQVVGIYLGWHGRRFPWYFNHVFTFWDRKQTAHQVGQNGMITTLLELEDIVKFQDTGNTMVTLGHSFGGAALFSSIQSVMAERYIRSRPFNSTNAVGGFGDLVVLLNPAFEAMLYHSLYSLSQDECRAYPEDQPPRLMMLSANEDWAVRWTFPIGRLPNVLFETHETTVAEYCSPFNKNDISEYQVKEWYADMLGVGHHDAYVTHFLTREEGCEYTDEKAEQIPASSIYNITKNERTQVGPCLTVTSKNRVQRNNPYINFFTEGGIIGGHNDIWQPELMNFIFQTVDARAKALVK